MLIRRRIVIILIPIKKIIMIIMIHGQTLTPAASLAESPKKGSRNDTTSGEIVAKPAKTHRTVHVTFNEGLDRGGSTEHFGSTSS